MHSSASPSLHPSLPLLLHLHSLNSTHQLGGVLCCCSTAAATPNTAAPPVQHSSGPLSPRVHAPQKTLLQEREQRGGSTAALHQVLHGGAVLQHGHPAPGEVDLHHQEGKTAALGVNVSVGQERHSLCSCSPHVNLDVGVCLFQLLPVELCSLLWVWLQYLLYIISHTKANMKYL